MELEDKEKGDVMEEGVIEKVFAYQKKFIESVRIVEYNKRGALLIFFGGKLWNI